MQLQQILVTLPLNEAQQQVLRDAAGSDIQFITGEEALSADISGVDAIIGNVPPGRLAEAYRLRWLQLAGIGAEGFLDSIPQDVWLTNAVGAYGQAVAEHAFAMLWTLLKKLHLYRDFQRQHVWEDAGAVASLRGTTVLILGMGDIGRHFARMAKGFDTRILAVRRQIAQPVEGADETHTLSDLHRLLPRADVVLLCLPGSDATRHILDAAAFSQMKPGSVFLNVGRGISVDTDALCQALLTGRIAAAGLDVTDPEPLPRDHPLWDMPDVLITPHTAGGFHLAATLDGVVRIAAENLRRINAGDAPKNIVHRGLGYVTKDA